MKIHSICVIKDESDIIEQTLISAVKWSDFIYVLDNGSTDGTWEKVLTLSQEYQQIIPYKQDNCAHHQALGADVFHHYLANSLPGDWWCRLDADEIYIDDPRHFLAEIPQQYQAVWAASFQYFFTDKDLEIYNQQPSIYDDAVPVEKKCHYYLNNWSEARFFRYDHNLVWDKDQGWPYFGAIYPFRIRLKHYQYRSPQQIQKRISVRLLARARGSQNFIHESQVEVVNKIHKQDASVTNLQLSGDEWKAKIKPAAQLDYDNNDGVYVLREDLMPNVPVGNPLLINKMRIMKRYFRRLKELVTVSK
ncbi:MAG TPA: glycosyltransferase family 2 protein [Trichormus sp. M33_DOE_039]|nr:glycosyltransferase family 2 protein [Trichormus sp. M33_DOE_039]